MAYAAIERKRERRKKLGYVDAGARILASALGGHARRGLGRAKAPRRKGKRSLRLCVSARHRRVAAIVWGEAGALI